jgi:hypothetical protein
MVGPASAAAAAPSPLLPDVRQRLAGGAWQRGAASLELEGAAGICSSATAASGIGTHYLQHACLC